MMTEQEEAEFIAKGGEFGQLIAKLTARAIDAESLAESLQTTVHIQESEIERLGKRCSNAERQRDDAFRDLRLMNDGFTKMAAVIREIMAQRLQSPSVLNEPKLTGAPPNPRDLQIVRQTAIEHAAREANG